VFALVITGPPGAGKTAVLEALTSAHPPLDDVRWPMPVEAVCGGL
jgi:ABC-type molybdenum transport system ATPase subunit/photorepair protein PhrA